mgnify:CR=1 FL=1
MRSNIWPNFEKKLKIWGQIHSKVLDTGMKKFKILSSFLLIWKKIPDPGPQQCIFCKGVICTLNTCYSASCSGPQFNINWVNLMPCWSNEKYAPMHFSINNFFLPLICVFLLPLIFVYLILILYFFILSFSLPQYLMIFFLFLF